MTRRLVETAVALADVLARENAALAAMNLPQAAAMLADKQKALASFAAAQSEHATASKQTIAEVMPVAQRLQSLATDNKRLLEYAMRVQGRVLGIVAGAAARASARPLAASSRYGATGTLMATQRIAPVVVFARV